MSDHVIEPPAPPVRGAEEEIAPVAVDAQERRLERIAVVTPFFDRIDAVGYLPSLFPNLRGRTVSVGDVLRRQYGELGGAITLGFGSFFVIADAVRTLEGQVTLMTGIAADTDPDDASYQQGYDKGFEQGFATAQEQSRG